MSSSSSDPKVQHVWRLLAKASVEHELAHQQRHEDAATVRSHVHNAVKHTVRAANAIRDTLETEEQFDLVMELESKFRPVLFKSIRDVIAQKRRLAGGEGPQFKAFKKWWNEHYESWPEALWKTEEFKERNKEVKTSTSTFKKWKKWKTSVMPNITFPELQEWIEEQVEQASATAEPEEAKQAETSEAKQAEQVEARVWGVDYSNHRLKGNPWPKNFDTIEGAKLWMKSSNNECDTFDQSFRNGYNGYLVLEVVDEGNFYQFRNSDNIDLPWSQRVPVPDDAEIKLQTLFNELEDVQRRLEATEQALRAKETEKAAADDEIAQERTRTTNLEAYRQKVETQLTSFQAEYEKERAYHEQVDQLNKRYGEKQEFLKIATKIRTSIFTPYVDRNTTNGNGPDINAVMQAFAVDSSGNPFASPWTYPAIDKDVAAAWTAAPSAVKDDFKKLAGAAANENLVDTFHTVTESLTGIRGKMITDFKTRQHNRETWRGSAETSNYQMHSLTEDGSIQQSLESLNSVNIDGEASTVKVLLEDLSRAIRIVVRVLNRDIVDGGGTIDYNPAVQKCSREGYIRWVNDEEQKQPTQTDPAQANLEFSENVAIDQGKGGEKFYGPFFKVLAPTKNGHTVTNPTNDDFYTQSIKPSVQNVLQGGSVMTVAYGYSGSGKTFGFFGNGQKKGSLQMFLRENQGLPIKVRARELYGEARGHLGCALENLTHLTGQVYEFDAQGDMGDAVGTNIAANLPDHLYYTVPDKWYNMWDMNYYGTKLKSVHDLPVGQWFESGGQLGFVVGKFEHPTDTTLDRTIVAYETSGVGETKPILHHEGTDTLFESVGNALTEGSYYIMQQHHIDHYDRDVGTSFSVTNTGNVVKISSKNAEFEPSSTGSRVEYKSVNEFRKGRHSKGFKWNEKTITAGNIAGYSNFSDMGTVCALSNSHHQGKLVKLFAHCRCTELKDKVFEIQWKPVTRLAAGGKRKDFMNKFKVTKEQAINIVKAWGEVGNDDGYQGLIGNGEEFVTNYLAQQNANADADSSEQKSPEQPDSADVAPEGVYSTDVHPLLTKRQRIMALDVDDESRWHDVNPVEYYKKVQASRKGKKHIMATSNNPESSRGHLALSLRVQNGKNVGVWTILDMAGCERPVAIAREEICDDFDKRMTWNHYFREHSGESQMEYKLTEVGLLSDSCKENDNLDLTTRLERSAKVIQQGYFINESNNHFMSFLRSHDVETGTVNPQFGNLDKGMREYQRTKFGSRYETNGVATLLDDTSTHGKLVYRLGDLEDDQKYVLDNMYRIPTPLMMERVAVTAVFEQIQVKRSLLDKLQQQEHWNRFECKFKDVHPLTDRMTQGPVREDIVKRGKGFLNVGSNSTDIEFEDISKYDSWMNSYYAESAKQPVENYNKGCLKIVTAYLIAKERDSPHRMVLLRPQKDFYAWCGNVSAEPITGEEKEEDDYAYYDENGQRGGGEHKYRCPSLRTVELDASKEYDFWVSTGTTVEKKNKPDLGGPFNFKDLLTQLYSGDGGPGRIIRFLSGPTPSTGTTAQILVYPRGGGEMIGCLRKNDFDELASPRLDSTQNRMVLYLNSHSLSAKIVDKEWDLYLAGQEEVDREYASFTTIKRLVGPNLSNSNLVDPVGKEKFYNQKKGKSQQFTQHPNPLIVGPESALFYQSKPTKRGRQTGFEEIAEYSRYDPNKMYSNPVAHLYGKLVKNHSNLDELKLMYDGESIPLIQASQRESIRRWNEWYECGRAGPEPLSGYVGMVDFCRGCTVQGNNKMPAKVVVCLTARSERIGDGSDKLRVSQALGVRETMRYADLLNPLSTRSIVQIQKGKQSNITDTWTFVTKNFPVQVNCNAAESNEELLSSPSLYWSLKGGEESLFHLQDLIPSSADEGEEEEESVVMEFDIGSERPSFW